ncbi:hypothetical protein ACFV80_39760 [Streptomyces sp. NPDC059862]|uniref:hypothetical protein n=1 Tax=Streptomyces sp. NPDC059862 TaxID=3346975 RepID=UPI0036538165
MDRRFLSTLLYPSFIFLTGCGALVATQLGWTRTLRWCAALDGSRQVLLTTAAVTATLLLCLLLSVHLRTLVQLYEGYWHGPLGRLVARAGVKRQQTRWDALDTRNPADFEKRYYFFPAAPETPLPTRLGNVLRAAESYPGSADRYGMDGVFFWPRLYSLLPDSLRTSLADARSDLERMLVLSALAGVFSPTALAFALFGDVPPAVWLPSAGGTALLSVAAYRGAIRAALGYGELVRAAFDVHRRDLLQRMGLVLPENLDAERALWTALGQQLYGGLTERPELLRFTPAADEWSGLRQISPPTPSGPPPGN